MYTSSDAAAISDGLGTKSQLMHCRPRSDSGAASFKAGWWLETACSRARYGQYIEPPTAPRHLSSALYWSAVAAEGSEHSPLDEAGCATSPPRLSRHFVTALVSEPVEVSGGLHCLHYQVCIRCKRISGNNTGGPELHYVLHPPTASPSSLSWRLLYRAPAQLSLGSGDACCIHSVVQMGGSIDGPCHTTLPCQRCQF